MDIPYWIAIIVSVIGAIASLLGMGVSISQAKKARKSSQAAIEAISRVKLITVAERLKSSQVHIRAAAPNKIDQRGNESTALIDSIRKEFDKALSELPKSGVGGSARKLLVKAQKCLEDYSGSLSSEADEESWRGLQVLVQDTISNLTSTASNIGEPK